MTVNGKDTYYFSHDANARNDPKVMALIADHGMAGYGMWWTLVEILREQQDYHLEQKEYIWLAIAKQMLTTPEEARAFVTQCVSRYELLDADEAFFWSPSLLRRMNRLDDIRVKRAESGKLGGTQANAKQVPSKCLPNGKQSDIILSSLLYEIYASKIRVGARHDAMKWIKRRVAEHGEEAVRHAIEVYAEACKNKDAQYRYQANNFFGTKAYYLDYLNGAAKQPERTLRSLDGEQ